MFNHYDIIDALNNKHFKYHGLESIIHEFSYRNHVIQKNHDRRYMIHV